MMGNDVGYLSEGKSGAHHGCMAQRGIGYLTKKKRAQLISGIDVTAFAAVMVVLFLAIEIFQFLLFAPHHVYAPSVDFARVYHSVPVKAANRWDSIKVWVMRDGTVYLGRNRITAKELPSKVQGMISAGSERAVYINADARTKYGNVKEVLEGVRAAGIERVVFLVEDRRDD